LIAATLGRYDLIRRSPKERNSLRPSPVDIASRQQTVISD
jgi:hypothetical protein